MRQMLEATDSAIRVESLQQPGKHSRWGGCIIDGNKIDMAVLSLATLCEWDINAIPDLTWRKSFLMDIQFSNFVMSTPVMAMTQTALLQYW